MTENLENGVCGSQAGPRSGYGRRWRILPHDADRISSLASAAGIPPVLAQTVLCRQIADPRRAQTFWNQLKALRDPAELPGCIAAAQRIRTAIAAGQRIVVHGDYDVDGMTATAILYLCLKTLGPMWATMCPTASTKVLG